jgi:hypothetical protein
VASIKVKAYPQINEGLHWHHLLVFAPEQLEAVTEAVNELRFGEGMAMHFIMGCFPPAFEVLTPFFFSLCFCFCFSISFPFPFSLPFPLPFPFFFTSQSFIFLSISFLLPLPQPSLLCI